MRILIFFYRQHTIKDELQSVLVSGNGVDNAKIACSIFHILSIHKKCLIYAKMFPYQTSFENHMKIIHHKASPNYSLERESRLNHYKK